MFAPQAFGFLAGKRQNAVGSLGDLLVFFGVKSGPENAELIRSPVIASKWNLAIPVEFLPLNVTRAVWRTLGS